MSISAQAGCRSKDRIVHIWTDVSDPRYAGHYVGGLQNVHGITNRDFLHMIKVLVRDPGDCTVLDPDGDALPSNNAPLQKGDYAIRTKTVIAISEEPVLTRSRSMQEGARLDAFRSAVRQRDGRCVITKTPVAMTAASSVEPERWKDFAEVHIFPHAHESVWHRDRLSRFIDPVFKPPRFYGGSINSAQNGLLLRRDLHNAFDQYHFAISPDEGRKAIVFDGALRCIAGLGLDPVLLADPRRPPDELLRWHYKQAVLANVRGQGQPVFDENFATQGPDSYGLDSMRALRKGPNPKERFEFEIANRLGPHVPLADGLDQDDDEDEE